MTKPNSLPMQSPQNAPTVPDFIASEDAGKGISYKPEDHKLLMLVVGQVNSPFVDKNAAEYIAGSEPGCLAIRELGEVFDGIVGIDVVPIIMQQVWIGWHPARGGYEGRYPEKPADAVSTIIQEGNRSKTILTRPSGTVIEECREVYLLFRGQPLLFPCRSTFITVTREWMTYASQFHTDKGDPLPLFARQYKLTTVPKSNALGRWYKPKFQDLGYVSRNVYLAARELYAIASRGALRVELSGERDDPAA
jgi:hypothetical protein